MAPFIPWMLLENLCGKSEVVVMKIKEVLSYDVESHDFQPVIYMKKYPSPDVVESIVRSYVITDDVAENLYKFLYNINIYSKNPQDSHLGIWISGYYGSGKSHFANVVRFLIEDRELTDGTPVREFIRAKKLPGVRMSSEIALQIDALKKRNILVVATDISHEASGAQHLLEFLAKEVVDRIRHERYSGLGVSEADYVYLYALEKLGYLEELEDEIRRLGEYPLLPWLESEREKIYKYVKEKVEGWFSDSSGFVREFLMPLVQDEGYDGLLFIVDEIEGYLSGKKETEEMDRTMVLHGLLHTIGEERAESKIPIWFTGIAQYKLEERVGEKDFAERLKDRFGLKISFSSSNVKEVVSKRLLQKKEEYIELLKKHIENNIANIRSGYLFKDEASDKMAVLEEYPFQTGFVRLISDILFSYSGSSKGKGSNRSTMNVIIELLKEYVSYREVPKLIPLWTLPDKVEGFYSDERISRIRRRVEEKFGKDEEKLFSLMLLVQYSSSVSSIEKGANWKNGMKLDDVAALTYDDITKNFSEHRNSILEVLEKLVNAGFVNLSAKGLYRALSDTEWEVEQRIRDIRVDLGSILENKVKFIKDDISLSLRGVLGKVHDVGVIYVTTDRIKEIIKKNNPTILVRIVERDCKPWVESAKDSEIIVCVHSMKKVDELIKRYEKFARYASQVGGDKERLQYANIQMKDLEEKIRNELSKVLAEAEFYHNGHRLEDGALLEFPQRLKHVVLEVFRRQYSEYVDETVKNFSIAYYKSDRSGFEKVSRKIEEKKSELEGKKVSDVVEMFSRPPYGFDRNAILASVAYLHSHGEIDLIGIDGKAVKAERAGKMSENDFLKLQIALVEKEPTLDERRKVKDAIGIDSFDYGAVEQALRDALYALTVIKESDADKEEDFQDIKALVEKMDRGRSGLYAAIKEIAGNYYKYRRIFKYAKKEKAREIEQFLSGYKYWRNSVLLRVKGSEIEQKVMEMISDIEGALKRQDISMVQMLQEKVDKIVDDYRQKRIQDLKAKLEASMQFVEQSLENAEKKEKYLRKLRSLEMELNKPDMTFPRFDDIANEIDSILEMVKTEKDIPVIETEKLPSEVVMKVVLPKGPIDLKDFESYIQDQIRKLKIKEEIDGVHVKVEVEVKQ